MLIPLVGLWLKKKKAQASVLSYLSVSVLTDFPHALETYLLTEGGEDVYFPYLIGAPAHSPSTLQLSS